jgi:cytochrome bd-type quinol oxidase subunit 1
MERAVWHWAKVLTVAVATSVLVTALALLFPDPVKTAADVLGPILFLGACMAFLLGLGILWNDYWARRSHQR